MRGWTAQDAMTPSRLLQRAEALLQSAEPDAARNPTGRQGGGHATRRAGHEGEFRQYRGYQPQDRSRDIDWRRSARGDDLLVRERENARKLSLDIRFENSSGLDFRSRRSSLSKRDACMVVTLALALHLTRAQDLVTLHGQRVALSAWPEVLLSRLYSNDAVFDSRSGHGVTLWLGDFIAEDAVEKLAAKAGHALALLQVLDPVELTFPFQGRALFRNADLSVPVNDASAIRDAYLAKLDERYAQLAECTRRRGGRYERVASDADLTQTFNRLLFFIRGVE